MERAVNIVKAFTEHPASVNETYFQHMRAAGSFSISLFVATLCCAIHAIFPFLFVKTGSNMIEKLYDRMCVNRDKTLKRQEASNTEDSDDQKAA